jgi:hypothetical protein
VGCGRWWRCQNRRAAGRSCRQSHRRRPYSLPSGRTPHRPTWEATSRLAPHVLWASPGPWQSVSKGGVVVDLDTVTSPLTRPRVRVPLGQSSSQCVPLGRRRWRWRRGAPDDARWRDGRPLRVGQAAQHEQGEEPGQGASAADSKVVHLWRCGWSGRRPRSVLGGSVGRWRLWSLLGWRLPSRRFCPASPAWVFQRGLPWMRGRSDREEERVT